MKQHVNLYALRFQPTRPFLPGKIVIEAFVLTLVLLLSVYGYTRIRVWNDANALEALNLRQAAEQKRLAELATRYPPAEIDAQLESRIHRLTAVRDAKTRLLRLLAGHRLGNTSGFSSAIAALARRRVPGLWLSEIHIHDGGRSFSLTGSTVHAELVPRLIQRLGAEEIFVGRDFRSVRMKRSEDEPRRIDFTLSTEGEVRP